MGTNVEIDELKFEKRQYNMGKIVTILGGIERGTNECLFAVIPTEQNNFTNNFEELCRTQYISYIRLLGGVWGVGQYGVLTFKRQLYSKF